MIIVVPKSPDNTVQKATNLRYVFIDESGDLGRFGNRYFVIAGLVTKDKKPLDRIIKRIRQRRLKKSIKELVEIKAHSADETIRKEVLDKVKQTDVEIYALVLDKNKVFSNLFDVQNRFYNYLVGQMLSRINLEKEKVIINIDKKHTNSFLIFSSTLWALISISSFMLFLRRLCLILFIILSSGFLSLVTSPAITKYLLPNRPKSPLSSMNTYLRLVAF